MYHLKAYINHTSGNIYDNSHNSHTPQYLLTAFHSPDSGHFYSSRYVIFRDTPLIMIAREIAIPRGLRYPRIAILGYNAISRSVVNTGIANGRIGNE